MPNIWINPLNADLNPIYHLLALLGVHHIFHVSRVRVKALVKHFTSNNKLDPISILSYLQAMSGIFLHLCW